MHDLPDEFDPSLMVGRTLDRVCFGANFAMLEFDGNVTLTAYGLLDHGSGGPVAWTDRDDVETDSRRLAELPGQTVRLATVEDGATLALTFENREVLRAVADTDMYECYHLEMGEHRIIV
jgi:hypothetical protein